jgi:hypothetical protein
VRSRWIARAPAELYALVAGATLVLTGIVGFFYNAAFTSNRSVHDDLFGIFAVNGWANVLHIATGVLGLLAVGYFARACALGLGVIYIALAISGFIVGGGHSILSIVPVNTEDNALHLLIGLAGIAAYAATPRG